MRITLLLKQYFAFSFIFLSFFQGIKGQPLAERELVAEGNNKYLQQDYRTAITKYSKVLSINVKNLKANFNIGNAFYETKQYTKAQKHFLKVIENTTDSKIKSEAYHNIGNCFIQMRKYKEAVNAYKNALRNNPKDNQTRYNLALARKLSQKRSEPKEKKEEPKLSDYAKKKKEESEEEAKKGDFLGAYKIMGEALEKDSTVLYSKDYIKKLKELTILDTIK